MKNELYKPQHPVKYKHKCRQASTETCPLKKRKCLVRGERSPCCREDTRGNKESSSAAPTAYRFNSTTASIFTDPIQCSAVRDYHTPSHPCPRDPPGGLPKGGLPPPPSHRVPPPLGESPRGDSPRGDSPRGDSPRGSRESPRERFPPGGVPLGDSPRGTPQGGVPLGVSTGGGTWRSSSRRVPRTGGLSSRPPSHRVPPLGVSPLGLAPRPPLGVLPLGVS